MSWSNPEKESAFKRLGDFSHEEEEMEIEGIKRPLEDFIIFYSF